MKMWTNQSNYQVRRIMIFDPIDLFLRSFIFSNITLNMAKMVSEVNIYRPLDIR